MIKQIFKTSLIVTVISLVITLVMLPFGVRSMVDTANQWAEYASYEVEYQEPAGSVTQVNVKFTGLEWQSSASNSRARPRTSSSPPAACRSTTLPPRQKPRVRCSISPWTSR